jgi:hypothetical protein
MKRETAEIASSIIDRIDKLEKIILELQSITNSKSYKIVAKSYDLWSIEVNLEESSIANEVFSQDVLDYFINTLNLELEEEQKKLDELD